MMKNEFIEELERLGFKKSPRNVSYVCGQMSIWIGENSSGINFGTQELEDIPTDFEGMIKYLKRIKK